MNSSAYDNSFSAVPHISWKQPHFTEGKHHPPICVQFPSPPSFSFPPLRSIFLPSPSRICHRKWLPIPPRTPVAKSILSQGNVSGVSSWVLLWEHKMSNWRLWMKRSVRSDYFMWCDRLMEMRRSHHAYVWQRLGGNIHEKLRAWLYHYLWTIKRVEVHFWS